MANPRHMPINRMMYGLVIFWSKPDVVSTFTVW